MFCIPGVGRWWLVAGSRFLSSGFYSGLLYLLSSRVTTISTRIMTLTISPFLTNVMVMMENSLLLVTFSGLTNTNSISILSLTRYLSTIISINNSRSISCVLMVTRRVINNSTRGRTITLVNDLSSNITLRLMRAFLQRIIIVRIIITRRERVNVRRELRRSLLLVILLRRFLERSTLLNNGIRRFPIMTLTARVLHRSLNSSVTTTSCLTACICSGLNRGLGVLTIGYWLLAVGHWLSCFLCIIFSAYSYAVALQ